MPFALLPSGLARDVTIEVTDGIITSVRPGSSPDSLVRRFDGMALPGLAHASPIGKRPEAIGVSHS